MRKLKSCGVLVLRRTPELSFLLMKHRNRYDLPKGHLQEGETEIECALRELKEETGIIADKIEINPDFRYNATYFPQYKRFGGETVEKTLVIFLGYLAEELPIETSEHAAFEWIVWNPPHHIQLETIDPLLEQVTPFIAT